VFRGVIEDTAAPGAKLVELEDTEEGSRILVPLSRVPELNLRPAGKAMEAIQEELSSQFEEPLLEDAERHRVIEELVTEGSPRSLARALKRLHFIRQTTGLPREEEQTRKKVRSWLAAEVAIARDCPARSAAFMTRVLQTRCPPIRSKKGKRRPGTTRGKGQKKADPRTRGLSGSDRNRVVHAELQSS
jgi:RNA polymerase-interacting CarD/CdnL/TRCF family regulator